MLKVKGLFSFGSEKWHSFEGHSDFFPRQKEKEGVLLHILILILPPQPSPAPCTHTIIVRVQVTTDPVVVFVENKSDSRFRVRFDSCVY